ncbi:MAG: LLM class flavin-dependent oxidoreductase [Alphaproteobacteria bacterium]
MARKQFSIVMQDNDPCLGWAEKVALLETLGYDAAWLTDSQLLRREIYVCLAACVLRTTRIKLGTSVTSPVTRHVSVSASAIASLEEMSNGRILIGIGTGNSAVRPMGLKPATLAALEAYVVTLKRMLSAESVPFENGRSARLTWLAGPAKTPLYIAATGPKATKAAARVADGVILYQGLTPDAIANGLRLVREGALEAGRDPKSIDVMLWACLGISHDREEARRHVRGRVASVLNFSNIDLFQGEEREIVSRIKQAYAYTEHLSPDPRHAALVPDGILDKYALAGTPDEILRRVRMLSAIPEVSQIILLPQATDEQTQPFDQIARLFATEVMDRL